MTIRHLAAVALFAAAASSAAAQPVETIVHAGPSGRLEGTMLSPGTSASPVVIIIPGSGPVDRDGNGKYGLKAASYRLLAEGLATHGITTIRIDKRGMFGSAAAVPDANAVTIADYAADIRSWTAAIRAKTGTACLWLLGHSEGGLVALAAAKSMPDVCGLILIAAPGRRMSDIIGEQIKASHAGSDVVDEALSAIDALAAGRRVDTAQMSPALLPIFHPHVQNYLIDLFSYDPTSLLAGYDKPVLILQGQRDVQVGEVDAQRLKEANPRAKLVLLPDTNHVLKAVTSADLQANVATYTDPNLPLTPGITDTIAQFVTASTAGSPKP